MNQDTSQENSEPNAFWRSRYSIGCVGAQFDAYAAHTSRLLGSTVDRIVSHAACSVLVVRERERP